MKKRIIILTVFCVICFGCTPIKKTSQNQKQSVGDDAASVNYNISTLVYGDENTAIRVEYPEIDGNFQHLENLNELIKQELKEQLEIISESNFYDIDMQIGFNTTFKSNNLVCFLFEGQIYRDGAAHPISVGFSVCISLQEAKLVLPKAYLTVDGVLVQEFLSQVKKQPADSDFSESEWVQIIDYIEQHSNSEILQIFLSEECVFSLEKDSIVVLFPVPHVIGDYLKISIPYSWENAVLPD